MVTPPSLTETTTLTFVAGLQLGHLLHCMKVDLILSSPR